MSQESYSNEYQIILKGISYLRTHWFLFVIEFVLVCSFFVFSYRRTEPVYQSTASLLIDLTRKNFYQSFMGPGLSPTSINVRKQNIIILLTGQEVMDYFRNNLMEYYESEGKPPYLRPFFPNDVAVPAGVLKAFISLNADKMSDIYSIRCTASNADAAFALCLNYLNTVEAYYPEIGQRESLLKRQYLLEQIQKLNQQTQESEKALSDFQEKRPDFVQYYLLNLDERGVQKLRDEINDLKGKIASNRQLKDKILRSKMASRGESVEGKKAIEALQNSLSELRYQLVLLESSIAPEGERQLQTKSIQLKIKEITYQLAELNRRDIQNSGIAPFLPADMEKRMTDIDFDHSVAVSKLTQLEQQFNDLVEKDKTFSNDKREYERIQSELNNRRRLLANLYTKEQETQLELSTGSAEVFRLEEPRRYSFRMSPQITKFTYAAISTSAFLFLITVALLIVLVPRLDSEADVNRFNLPILGKIPVVRIGKTFSEIPSASMENLKIMNYRILRETKGVQCPVIVMTSAYSAEGKTTVCQLLTLSSQAPTRRTLLIDGDLQTTRPSKFFSISEGQTPGVAAIVDGVATLNMNTVISKTIHEGIDFLPRGHRSEPSGDPNFLKPMKAFIQQCRSKYDVIFIDTPPLFATSLSQFWLEFADLIIVVARVYHSHPNDVQEAISMCKLFSKSPVGLALNGVRFFGGATKKSNYYFSRRKSVQFNRAA